MRKYAFVLVLLMLMGCGEDAATPKPRAFLSLNYPEAEYEPTNLNCP